jgi:RNA polymerase sigma-70 factor, ECF subfamily
VASPAPSVADEELARQCQAGSLEAFEELVHRYERRVFGFIANTCRSHSDASEITQDTFVRAFQAIHQFDPGRAFRPWLFTIARRKCLDHRRANGGAQPTDPVPDSPDQDDPATLLIRQEDHDDLWRVARRCLPAVQFQTLWLKYAGDLSVADISIVLGKSQAHVKVLLYRARQTLGRHLTRRVGAVDAGPAASNPGLANPNLERPDWSPI